MIDLRYQECVKRKASTTTTRQASIGLPLHPFTTDLELVNQFTTIKTSNQSLAQKPGHNFVLVVFMHKAKLNW